MFRSVGIEISKCWNMTQTKSLKASVFSVFKYDENSNGNGMVNGSKECHNKGVTVTKQNIFHGSSHQSFPNRHPVKSIWAILNCFLFIFFDLSNSESNLIFSILFLSYKKKKVYSVEILCNANVMPGYFAISLSKSLIRFFCGTFLLKIWLRTFHKIGNSIYSENTA